MDSTVIAEEGIDILADFCGAAEAVADLTSRCCRVYLRAWAPPFSLAMPTYKRTSFCALLVRLVEQWKRKARAKLPYVQHSPYVFR